MGDTEGLKEVNYMWENDVWVNYG